MLQCDRGPQGLVAALPYHDGACREKEPIHAIAAGRVQEDRHGFIINLLHEAKIPLWLTNPEK